jgi:hypothetical protein
MADALPIRRRALSRVFVASFMFMSSTRGFESSRVEGCGLTSG